MTTPFRPGSTGHLASQQLEINGPMTTAALAAAVDKPEDELSALLAFPMRLDLLRHDPATDLWSLGDGTRRQPNPPPAAPRPAPAPIQRHVVPPAVRDLPAAAPPAPAPTKPRPAVRQTRGQQVQRALNVAAQREAADAPVTQGVDIDAVYRAVLPPDLASIVTASPPLAAAPAPATPATPATPALAPIRGMHPIDVMGAWCSDGTYVLEKGGLRIELNLDEAALIADHMRTVFAGLDVGVSG